jgi:nucleoside-diphosphate-sugar epimerase
MANYLVTGGAGFIGSHLVRALIERGDSVRVLDNFDTGRRENLAEVMAKIDLLEGDMREPETAMAAAADMDYVLHQAALPSVPRSVEAPVETTQINVMGTVNLLEAARQAKVRRFVYAASSSAYGDQAGGAKVETMTPRPLSPYAAAKLAGEQFCQSFANCFGLETICLRYFNVFGARQNPNSQYSAVIPLFICAALSGKPPTIDGDGSNTRDFTYIDNVVRGNLLAATSDKGVGETMNLATGNSVTILELWNRIAGILGVQVEPRFGPPRAGDVAHSLANIQKARDLLRYEAEVDFDEGLRRTIAYYRESGDGWE